MFRSAFLTYSLLAITWIYCAPAVCFAAVQATFYVASDGRDDNPGTEARPFASIDRARQAVRTVNKNMTGDIVVMLGGGTYRIERTISFGPDDSGTGGHNVVYRAKAGEMPILSGGKPVTGWQKDENGRWKAAAPVADFRQLYVDGKRATRARGAPPAELELAGEDGYTTTDVAMADWKNPGDLEFCYQVVWAHTRCKVQSIHRDGDRAVITMLQPHFTHARSKEGVQLDNWTGSPPYDMKEMCLENALELLDEPGEWYLDRPAKTVYYLPRQDEDLTKAEVIAPAIEKLVELRGTLDRPVHNICFQGIEFQHGSWLLPSEIGFVDLQANFVLDWKKPFQRSIGGSIGVTAVHNEVLKSPANVVCHAAKSILFERCVFTRLGGAGLDIEYGSQDNVIEGCRFHDIAGTAVQVGDVLKDDHHPDDPRKLLKNNVVRNCYIHDCGVEYLGSVGVFAGYTEGTVIAHNEITRLPYSGISVGWGWGEEDAGGGNPVYEQPFKYDTPTSAKNNRIEYNHIHGVMSAMVDGGGVYTLGNMPGTVIRGNHIYNNPGPPGGVYLDEGSGSIEVTRNIVYHVPAPTSYNNHAQNRIATCNVHDNWFGDEYAEDVENVPLGAKKVICEAGLQPEYRDLVEKP